MSSARKCYCERKDFVLCLGCNVYYMRGLWLCGKQKSHFHLIAGSFGSCLFCPRNYADPSGCNHGQQKDPPPGADHQHRIFIADAGYDHRQHPLHTGKRGSGPRTSRPFKPGFCPDVLLFMAMDQSISVGLPAYQQFSPFVGKVITYLLFPRFYTLKSLIFTDSTGGRVRFLPSGGRIFSISPPKGLLRTKFLCKIKIPEPPWEARIF